jgi:hypothetical protein
MMGAPLLPGFKLAQTFFGFNASHRKIFHENIFNLIWYGEGRWDWNTIYNMPIFLRKFYINQVNAKHQEITDRNTKSSNSSKSEISRAPVTKK